MFCRNIMQMRLALLPTTKNVPLIFSKGLLANVQHEMAIKFH